MNPMIPLRRAAGAVLAVLVASGCTGAAQSNPPTSPPAPTRGTPSPAPTSSAPSEAASGTPSVAPPSGPFDPSDLSVTLETVAEGFQAPVAVVNASDGSRRLFVVEQGGLVWIVRDGARLPNSFLDVSGAVSRGGEQGLLGLAFHPDYPTDPRLFVDYTDTNGDTRVSSFSVDSSNPDRVDTGSEVRLLFIDQPYGNHNGGALAFGPDGYLYVALGDGGSGGDPHGNGQKLSTMLGKILRIDVDRTSGDLPYAIPDDNPFVDTAGAEPSIFLYGLRNPWRMSFDRATGDLWIGDVGQTRWEEIDVVRAGSSGLNFGWNLLEGSHCFRPESGCDESGLTMPVTEYSHMSGCTVIGGYVYRGSAQAALAGGYLFTDYCSGTIWAVNPAADGPQEPVEVGQGGATISSFGEDEAGELYISRLAQGWLLRVVATRG
jgi:glucose/arabinose dehydrogenase